ncbi:uncharacterized protein LOC123554969 [Mercenaria mercenaria]|uniref:uncharacterized protein LOC123554969 n=1 Tax=Mercenaria mercenaria TaxID=6596 RepID=UPI00234F49C2|nr:uncharacterized protein LOC123554969 [Mercenaria mercenaria]
MLLDRSSTTAHHPDLEMQLNIKKEKIHCAMTMAITAVYLVMTHPSSMSRYFEETPITETLIEWSLKWSVMGQNIAVRSTFSFTVHVALPVLRDIINGHKR